jgi:hypothetical protein
MKSCTAYIFHPLSFNKRIEITIYKACYMLQIYIWAFRPTKGDMGSGGRTMEGQTVLTGFFNKKI